MGPLPIERRGPDSLQKLLLAIWEGVWEIGKCTHRPSSTIFQRSSHDLPNTSPKQTLQMVTQHSLRDERDHQELGDQKIYPRIWTLNFGLPVISKLATRGRR